MENIEQIISFICNELMCLRAMDEKGSDRYEELTQAISWVEAQRKRNEFIDKIQIGDEVTRNKDGLIVNLSQFKRLAKS